MNFKLIQSLVSIINSLNEEEKNMVKKHLENQDKKQLNESTRQEQVTTSQNKANLFKAWVEKHRQLQHPHLNDEDISRETIYGEKK